MVRQFRLQNSLGQTFDLMNKDAFFYTPDGLGFRMDSEFFQIGNTYQLIETESAQKTPAGIMVFKNYALYRQFADFINNTPLKLMYKPQNEWVYLDCIVSRLTKAEIDYRDNRLKCNIDFQGLGKWYIPRQAQKSGTEVANSKKYTYSYDYAYADSITGTINIINNSSEDSPTIITIYGEITNPTWSLIVNNTTIQSGSVAATIASGDKLIVNSKDNELEIAEYTAAGLFVRNLYQYSDFTKDNFIYVPPGSSTLRVTGSVQDTIDAWIEIEELHETV